MEPAEKPEEEGIAIANAANPNKKPPVIVNYCAKCGLPTEYCEFDEKCKAPAGQKPAPAPAEEKKKGESSEKNEEKKGEEGEAKEKEEPKPRKKVAVKEDNKVVITKQTRSKKKFLTSVTGLEKFGVNIKDFSKKMGKKFACGASVVGDDTIEIQGDISEELKEIILKDFPQVNEKQMVFKEKK